MSVPNKFVNVTSTPIGHGLGTAADTLCSQAFGFKNYKRVGVILQRGVFILGLFVFPICGVWLNTESLLLLFHQPPCVATLSAFYINVYCVALPFLFLFILLQHYLQSQSLVWQFVLIGVIANFVNIIFHAIVIYGLHLGFKGAVVALVISTCLPTVLVIIYIRVRNLHKLTWGGWSFESLREWLQFLKLAIPGLIMLSFEWWSAEIANFIAGYISKNELAANAAFFQAASIVYMPAVGISMAISIRVGNELGAGNPTGAKRATYISIGCTLLLCVLYSILFLATKDYIGDVLVPGNEVVRKKIADLMIVAAIYVYFDHLQSTIGGVFRGSGRQYIGAIMNFISYYLIGLPLGITLALKVKWGVVGLWIGMTFGVIVLSLAFIVILFRTNWKKQSDIAMQRAKEFDGTSQSSATDEIKSDGPQESDVDLNKRISVDEEETSFLYEFPDQDSVELVQMTPLSNGSIEAREIEERTCDEENLTQKDNANETGQEKTRILSRTSIRHRIYLVLSRSGFFVVGVAVLVVGGVASQFHPPTDTGEYENCSISVQINDTSY